LFIGRATCSRICPGSGQDRFPGADDTKPPAQTQAPAKPAERQASATSCKPAEGEQPKHAAANAAAPACTVSCKDAFAKDSSHIKLATLFDSQNVTWDDVDGPEAQAQSHREILNDPKRRLE
jgi:hypothetical protein